MALSPFKAPESPLNRSRSSSCSSPVRNRIVYQEVYSIGPNTLVRSYSCDQVFDKDGNGRTFQTTQIQVSSFITPEKKIHTKFNERKPKQPRKLSVEPSVEKSDSGMKKTETRKKPRVIKTALKRTIMFTFLTITSACALYYYLSYRECGYTWDLHRTGFELEENIFGQNEAVQRIKSALKVVNDTNDIHTLAFIGGIGVGKTYTSSIISRNFPWSSNKLLIYSEHFTEDVETLLSQKLSTCGCNLIIVDDLSDESVKDAINLIALLRNKRRNNEKLLIILIFQTYDADVGNKVLTEFNKSFLNVNYILFQPLSREAVRRCFQSEMKRQGVVITKPELRKLVDEKLKHIDVVKGPPGCKGVDADVASYFKKILK